MSATFISSQTQLLTVVVESDALCNLRQQTTFSPLSKVSDGRLRLEVSRFGLMSADQLS